MCELDPLSNYGGCEYLKSKEVLNKLVVKLVVWEWRPSGGFSIVFGLRRPCLFRDKLDRLLCLFGVQFRA